MCVCVCVCVFLQPVEATDDAFWDQFWADTTTTVQDVFALVPAAEIRAVREESPSNLATLCYKVIPVKHQWRQCNVFCVCRVDVLTLKATSWENIIFESMQECVC